MVHCIHALDADVDENPTSFLSLTLSSSLPPLFDVPLRRTMQDAVRISHVTPALSSFSHCISFSFQFSRETPAKCRESDKQTHTYTHVTPGERSRRHQVTRLSCRCRCWSVCVWRISHRSSHEQRRHLCTSTQRHSPFFFLNLRSALSVCLSIKSAGAPVNRWIHVKRLQEKVLGKSVATRSLCRRT